ncbi:MAG: hypothetical protein EU549_03120 [Promethearchaeota archaeon]|nr:MAG: hypothetical protein EU549_03120 [Candidatus Lokiarchaeota archaeon]
MADDINVEIKEEEKKIVREIYSDYYNVKKHETSNLENIDLSQLNHNLVQIMIILEKIFLKILGIYPEIINLKKFGAYFFSEPVDKRQDFSICSSLVEKKSLLTKNPDYELFIKYITHISIIEEIQLFYDYITRCRLLKKGIEKNTKIISIDSNSIKFSLFNINKEDYDLDFFGEVYEFFWEIYYLRVTPWNIIEYPASGNDYLTIKFNIQYLDFYISNEN